MKRTFIAVALSAGLLASASNAGALSDPILEADVIEAATTSSGGIFVPLFFLLLALPVVTG